MHTQVSTTTVALIRFIVTSTS